MINKPLDLDELDRRILNSLQMDASQTNNDLAAAVHASPPTCLRRVKRLHDLGLIERTVCILHTDRLAPLLGAGLTAIVEVTLDVQAQAQQDAFQSRAVQDAAVQQCYRTSPGPDFVLIVTVADMPAFMEFGKRLLTQDANVRNVRSFFSLQRAKFSSTLPLP